MPPYDDFFFTQTQHFAGKLVAPAKTDAQGAADLREAERTLLEADRLVEARRRQLSRAAQAAAQARTTRNRVNAENQLRVERRKAVEKIAEQTGRKAVEKIAEQTERILLAQERSAEHKRIANKVSGTLLIEAFSDRTRYLVRNVNVDSAVASDGAAFKAEYQLARTALTGTLSGPGADQWSHGSFSDVKIVQKLCG